MSRHLVAFKLGLMVFNCLHNQAPQYLVDLCQSVSSVVSRQYLCCASRGLLVVPRHQSLNQSINRGFVQRINAKPLMFSSYAVAGPAIWNWLPDSLRDPATSRDSFTEDVLIFSLLVHIAHCSFLNGALYTFTYLLTWSATDQSTLVAEPLPWVC